MSYLRKLGCYCKTFWGGTWKYLLVRGRKFQLKLSFIKSVSTLIWQFRENKWGAVVSFRCHQVPNLDWVWSSLGLHINNNFGGNEILLSSASYLNNNWESNIIYIRKDCAPFFVNSIVELRNKNHQSFIFIRNFLNLIFLPASTSYLRLLKQRQPLVAADTKLCETLCTK